MFYIGYRLSSYVNHVASKMAQGPIQAHLAAVGHVAAADTNRGHIAVCLKTPMAVTLVFTQAKATVLRQIARVHAGAGILFFAMASFVNT